MLRRAQTTDLRSLGVGVQSTTDDGAASQKPRATSDDEDVPAARSVVTAAVATRFNRLTPLAHLN